MNDPRPISALTIAGSDSGGGAGIQADLKTFAAHGVHGLSAIAALTAQHTRGVTAVHVPDLGFLRAQLDACFDDFRIGAVKIGMLANAAVIDCVADALERHAPPHVVLDPVMVATSGAKLLEDAALQALRTRLIPLASIITPNIPEAELLLGHSIPSASDADTALGEFVDGLGVRAVLLKGAQSSIASTTAIPMPRSSTIACQWRVTALVARWPRPSPRISATACRCSLRCRKPSITSNVPC